MIFSRSNVGTIIAFVSHFRTIYTYPCVNQVTLNGTELAFPIICPCYFNWYDEYAPRGALKQARREPVR